MQPGPGVQGGFRPGLVVTGPQGAARGFPPGQARGQRPPQPPGLQQSSDVRSSGPPSLSKPAQAEVEGLGQSSGPAGDAQGKAAGQSIGSSEQKPNTESSGGTEMDWDTALDTILKTLRKDKVGEK
jgi:hypothetical protein